MSGTHFHFLNKMHREKIPWQYYLKAGCQSFDQVNFNNRNGRRNQKKHGHWPMTDLSIFLVERNRVAHVVVSWLATAVTKGLFKK